MRGRLPYESRGEALPDDTCDLLLGASLLRIICTRNEGNVLAIQDLSLRQEIAIPKLWTLIIVICSVLFSIASAEQRWRPVLVDGFGTAWMVDLSTIQATSEGTEVWIKKVFDPDKSAENFKRYKVKPSVYDVELWLFRPDRRVSMLQVVRYDAEGRTVETYDFQSKGQPPTQVIPPESSLDVIWKLVLPTGERN